MGAWVWAVLALAAAVAPASADDVDFAGAEIAFIVPYGPGGGSTLHARLIAPLLEQELPGRPTIVVRNIDGGGSIRGLNVFSRTARPDGLTIAALGTSSYFSYMLDVPSVEYPLPEFIPILASPSGVVAYGRIDFGLNGDPEHNVDWLRRHPPVLAGDGPTSGDMPVLYCYELLGIELKAVWGVSSGEARQAFLRGESQVNHDSTSVLGSDLDPMMRDGVMTPLFTMGLLDDQGRYGRDPAMPQAPACLELYELATGRVLDGARREVFDMMYAVRMRAAKAIVLPPNTADAIVETYQDAMVRVLNRPEIGEPFGRRVLGDYSQLTGDAAIGAHAAASSMSPAAKAELLGWLQESWAMRF